MYNFQECHLDKAEWLKNEVELVFIWAEPVKANSVSGFFLEGWGCVGSLLPRMGFL